jgi:hypothetical protein
MRQVTRPAVFLIACLAFMAVPLLPRCISDAPRMRSPEMTNLQLKSTVQCIESDDLDRDLVILRSNLADSQVSEVVNSFRNSAKKSLECRQQVIQALISAMRKRDSGPLADSERFSLWRHGANLLAELQATEALDLLVANLDVTDGLSVSLGHYPAVDAVTRMGERSVPKLQNVLSENSNRYMRKFAVFCIASIGGSEARSVLTKALSSETDPCVNRFIRISLEMFGNKSEPNHIPQGKDSRWISAFYCLT